MCVCSVFSQLTINTYSEITASFQQVRTFLCKYFVLIKIPLSNGTSTEYSSPHPNPQPHPETSQILGEKKFCSPFGKCKKVTIGLVMPVRPSVRMKQLGSRCTKCS